MTYRLQPKRPPKRNRDMQATSTPARFFIHNGTVAEFAIPCWYMEQRMPKRHEPHNRPHHDHVGWPSPNHPDRSCQDWEYDKERPLPHERHWHRDYIDMSRLEPIHLTEEGYTAARAVLGTPSDETFTNITATASIDETDDWVVRVTVDCSQEMEDPLTAKPVTIPVTIMLERDGKREVACLAKVTVLPATYK